MGNIHYHIPRGDPRHTPACWMKRTVTLGDDPAKIQTAVLRCPNPSCSKIYWLFEHQINEDGRVNPSVVCPHQCGFHAFVTLMDWTSAADLEED